MIDATSIVTLSAALTAGFAGSAHCVVMCGGFAGALGMRTRAVNNSASAVLRDASLYHVGRLLGYASAGALFGAFGEAMKSGLNLPTLSMTFRIAAGVLLVLIALKLATGLNPIAGLERIGARFWKLLQPLARRSIERRTSAHSLMLGLVWGWLPCGLVYSTLLYAALSGSAVGGSAIMLAFGIGTLPSMLTSSVMATQLHRWLQTRNAKLVSAAALLTFGLWMIWSAAQTQAHVHAM